MVAIVEELLQGNPKPVTTTLESSVMDALRLMLEHDFSQLPIVDDDGCQQGIVTAEGILKSQRNFGSSLDELLVRHVVTNATTASPSDDVFEVFERFEKNSAVLIVDNENKLMGIITPWDTAAYLQRRAEDIMLVEDIESALREHIQASFAHPKTGILDEEELNAAIEFMIDDTEANYKAIETSLKQYLGRNSLSHKPSREAIEQSFAKSIFKSTEAKSFDDLTFYQYTELLLHKDKWPVYGQRFGIDANRVRKLLDDVRETRNKLAHFRGEITNEERDRLRFCREWLERHPVPTYIEVEPTSNPLQTDNDMIDTDITPTDEELSSTESRYAKLAVYLQQIPVRESKKVFTFEEIEEILESKLPQSAYEHRSWWANDSVGHVQSKQWLSADWRVVSVNFSNKTATFARHEGRTKLYINFFSELLSKLRETQFPLRDVNPIGVSWIYVHALPKHRQGQDAFFNFSFTRGKSFRVELYIDTGEQEKNKQIFDRLFAEKDRIELEVGQKVTWERLNSKRASRIAIYHDGHINYDSAVLEELQNWAVSVMVKFEKVLSERTEKAIEEVS